jgi:quercetin 2,3-dioxygenase
MLDRASVALNTIWSRDRPGFVIQIWITPTQRGGSPAWGSQPFPKGERSGRFVTLASGFDEDEDVLPIRADARVLGATHGRIQSENGETAINPENRGNTQ